MCERVYLRLVEVVVFVVVVDALTGTAGKKMVPHHCSLLHRHTVLLDQITMHLGLAAPTSHHY